MKPARAERCWLCGPRMRGCALSCHDRLAALWLLWLWRVLQVQAGQPVAAADRDERADGDEDQRDGDDEDAERHREDRRGRP